MVSVFNTLDKFKPFFDLIDKIILNICKLLLIIDILITIMSITGRYVSFVKDPAWSEEVVLTCMTYMAVLSAALAIRKGSHIRMTVFDTYLSKKTLFISDLICNIGVLALSIIMIVVGFKYANGIGGKGTYISMPSISKFWMYFPVPLAGIVMAIFQLELIYKQFRSIFLKEAILIES